MSHTKGPWRVFERVSVIAEPDPLREVLPVVAQVIDHGDGALDANARLIAAAPELADQLDAMIKHYVSLAGCGDCGFWDPEEESEVIAARAVLAKARGES